MTRSIVQEGKNGVVLAVYVQPKASCTEWAGFHGSSLKLRVAAPPIDGAANEVLVRFLAKELSIPASAVKIEGGTAARHKRIALKGVRISEVETYLRRKGLVAA